MYLSTLLCRGFLTSKLNLKTLSIAASAVLLTTSSLYATRTPDFGEDGITESKDTVSGADHSAKETDTPFPFDKLPKLCIEQIALCLNLKDMSALSKTNKRNLALLRSFPMIKTLNPKRASDDIALTTLIAKEKESRWPQIQFSLDMRSWKGTDASNFSKIYKLNLYASSVSNVSALGGVHTLDLRECKSITDISALGKVHTLNLSYSSVADVSALGGVHDLDLYGCKSIRDVSALGKVHTLNLSFTKVTDVSMLGGVHTLNLEGTSVTDVSALGRVHTLNLEETSVTDVSALGGVHTLDLSWTDVTDVSALGDVHELNLSTTKVADVSMLGGVHTLYLRDCENVTDVSALEKVHTLYLRDCENVTDVSALEKVHTLDLRGCKNVTEESAKKIVGKVKDLTLPDHLKHLQK